MSTSTALRIFIAMTFFTALSACSLVPKQSTPSFEIEKGVTVALPTPNDLGYQLTASQLITATWNERGIKRQEQLPVQLQVNHVVTLAGFSAWGTRVLSLNYNGEQINTEVLAGLEGTLPEPDQVLFNLMITLWPSSAWEVQLNKVRWRMIDDEYSRVVLNSEGKKIIAIRYEKRDRLKGKISFNHLQYPFSISIQTLHYQLN